MTSTIKLNQANKAIQLCLYTKCKINKSKEWLNEVHWSNVVKKGLLILWPFIIIDSFQFRRLCARRPGSISSRHRLQWTWHRDNKLILGKSNFGWWVELWAGNRIFNSIKLLENREKYEVEYLYKLIFVLSKSLKASQLMFTQYIS